MPTGDLDLLWRHRIRKDRNTVRRHTYSMCDHPLDSHHFNYLNYVLPTRRLCLHHVPNNNVGLQYCILLGRVD